MLKAILAVVMILAVGVATSAEPPPKEKLAPDALKKKFYRSWVETERVKTGVSSKDPYELVGIEFNEKGTWTWGRRGELSTGLGVPPVVIDTTANPMRLEYVGGSGKFPSLQDGKRTINPGIFQFEGETLVVVVNHWLPEKDLEKGKDYPERPTEFKSTKENKWQLSKFKPAECYDQD